MPWLSRSLAWCLWLGVAVAMTLGHAQADPDLDGTRLLYGNSPRLQANSWAYFEFRVKNPDAVPVRVQLVLHPKDQRNLTIFETMLDLAPQVSLRYRTLVTAGTTEAYTAELYVGGNRVKSEEVVSRLGAATDRQLLFINDALEMEYGNFAKNAGIKGKFASVFCRAANVPQQWAGYDRAHLVTLMRPDFAGMQQRQYQALLEYVAQGGTLIFGDPQGVLEAADTPLRPLLNVAPLRVRPIEQLTALTALGGSTITWPAGEPFLESVPVGEGVTTLAQGEFPVVRWSRYGLGRVGVCAINPSQKGFRYVNGVADEANFNTIWLHLLSYGGRRSFASSGSDYHVVEALDNLTGVAIPPRSFVRQLLVGYLLVIVVVTLLGMVTRRQLTAWVGLGVLAIGATLWVFVYAQERARTLAPRTATVLDFRTWGTPAGAGDQIVSLFTKVEDTVTVQGQGPDSRLRALAPGAKAPKTNELFTTTPAAPELRGRAPGDANGEDLPETAAERKRRLAHSDDDQALRDPLRVQVSDGVASVPRLLLRPRAPQFFAALYSYPGAATTPLLPEVTWGAGGPQLTAWQVPAELQASAAALLCEAGVIPLDLRGSEVRLRSGRDFRPPSSEVLALQAFLTEHPHPSPALLLVGTAGQDHSGAVPTGFQVTGRDIYLIPVPQHLGGEVVQVPPERVVLNTDKGEARALRVGGRWAPVAPSRGMSGDWPVVTPEVSGKKGKAATHAPDRDGLGGDRHFIIGAQLPPEFSRLALEQVRVTFVGDNRGGNVQFALALRPYGATDGSRDLKPVSVQDDVYTFTVPAGLVLTDPRDGQLTVVLGEHIKVPTVDAGMAMRLNGWIVQQFNVGVSGRLPAEQTGGL